MALVHSFENSGNFLFRFRGHFPLVLFLLAVPVILVTDYSWMGAHPELYWFLTGASIALVLLGQVVRAWAIATSAKNTSGRNREEQIADSLNSTGIYSVVRHPLYVGNYFMWIGITFYVFNPWFVLVVSMAFWLYYERIMFAEERFLERKFGEAYVEWSKRVPAFLPRWNIYKKAVVPFSMKTVLRREYSGVAAAILGFLFVDLVRDSWLQKGFEWHWKYAWMAGAGILFPLIFRTLKHHTQILTEEDRS